MENTHCVTEALKSVRDAVIRGEEAFVEYGQNWKVSHHFKFNGGMDYEEREIDGVWYKIYKSKM